MHYKSGQISTPIITLLVVVVILAASTLYLTLLVTARPSTTLGTGVTTRNNNNPGQQQFPLSGSNGAASAQTNAVSSSPNTITVVGTGEASYTPNEALLQVSVQTANASAVSATSANARDIANVIQALNGIGISNSSIETQGYTLSTNYANCYSSCIPQIIGYSVTNNLQVNLSSSDPSQLGKTVGQAIDTAVKAGATGISLNFGASGTILNQATNAALQNAVTSAGNQAHAIASSLGVSITGVVSSSEANSYSPYYGNAVFAAAVLAPASIQTPIMPGTQTISVNVQVVYSIG